MSNVETEKINRVVKSHVDPLTQMLTKHEELHEKTQELQVQSYAQMERLQAASDMMTDIVVGEIPPNPDKLGLHLDMHTVKSKLSAIEKKESDKNEKWSSMKWTLVLGIVGSIGTGLGLLLWTSLGGPA